MTAQIRAAVYSLTRAAETAAVNRLEQRGCGLYIHIGVAALLICLRTGKCGRRGCLFGGPAVFGLFGSFRGIGFGFGLLGVFCLSVGVTQRNTLSRYAGEADGERQMEAEPALQD
ncbi:hypothetical protein AOE01nite_25150 [Acetobacter oeni]|uniref:Uncharacterized protein n=1 Tax=Acetobacter oeni TaxID=304077 RepID=A0A511XMW8_9PROT|nr:hypothetical protein AA21952_3166 [Acetobacter oeni LMG 21952]GEN64291.1 hypothetical protein AOE01nite_25150 [Acetobacter oeni]